MIVVELRGGLGNQMFQYALGRRLALERNTQLKMDLYWFKHEEQRHYELNAFNIQAEFATTEEVNRLRNFSKNRYLHNAFSTYQNHLNEYKRREIEEKTPGSFDPNVLNAPRHCYLIGYWQSERYFGQIAPKIRQEFTLKEPLSEPDQTLANEIQGNANSVSVHIRRGDYSSGLTGHWVCTLDYYQRAIQYIKSQTVSPHFYFFSDDIGWVKESFPHSGQETFIEPRIENKGFVDMFLITQCRHHINANSSFSWWGAWMGEQDNSIVIVPNQWFLNRPYPEDLVPARWLRL
jgi:hypothetical protein